MTNLTQQHVAVEQRDRDAAAALMAIMGRTFLPGIISDVLAGRADDHPYIKAFARNRLAERNRCARVAETCELVVPLSPGLPDGASAASTQIADAIRSGKEPA
ncbi:hypothetical protein JMG10_13235 [Nostoc ellipsosporum NOK]|nr:hypothetical protein [Nostoc ellipsosporum NOK]